MIDLYIILYKNRSNYCHFVIFIGQNAELPYNLSEKPQKKYLLGFLWLLGVLLSTLIIR